MEQLIRRLRRSIDLPAFFLMYSLIGIGIVLIYSATHSNDNSWMRTIYQNQIIRMVAGSVIFYLIIIIPSRVFFDTSYIIYGITLILLALVLVKGSATGGATRWFVIGPLKIQPSEFAKIGALLAMSRYLSSRDVSFNKISSLIMPFILFIIPTALVLKQPDLSTSLVFAVMFIVMIFWAGLSAFEIFFIISPVLSLILAFNIYLWALFFIVLFILLIKINRNISVTAVILAINFAIGIFVPIAWGKLHDYQQNRILSFVDPQRDPFGAGYQVIQSKVTIGSGEILGKGLFQGTQTKLSFLPEQHTDFIFSVLGEQFGFIGCIAIILLFSILISRLFYLAGQDKNRFLNLIVVGIASQFAFHIMTNISMTIGMMPVTGLPLPFISYGGSFLITCMALMGFAISIKKKNSEY